MQVPDQPSTACWWRDYLFSWHPLHQSVNPATDAELQLWPVWGWHSHFLHLRSFARVRLHWPCCRAVLRGHMTCDNKSSIIAEAGAAKWKRIKNKNSSADSLRHHYLRANYLAYLMCHHPWSTIPRHSVMAGSWWMVAVALSATHDLLSRRTYLRQGQLKRAGKMTARRRMREMMMYRGVGGFIWIWSDDSESSQAECSDSAWSYFSM